MTGASDALVTAYECENSISDPMEMTVLLDDPFEE